MNARQPMERELHAPTPEEIRAACEILLRAEPMNGEAFRVVADRLAADWRDHALGCLSRCREYAAWAREYPAGSDRHQEYRRLAEQQWKQAKFAARKHRENASWH